MEHARGPAGERGSRRHSGPCRANSGGGISQGKPWAMLF